ncbi:MAG: alpha/beta fold hydrolase [Arenicellales bacterium]
MIVNSAMSGSGMRLFVYALVVMMSSISHASDYRFHTITAFDGIPLNVVEVGNPHGEPVILLHGFSQSYLSWKRQLDDPNWRARYRLIAMDLRGHGASGKPWLASAYAGHEPWAKDLRAVLDALDIQKPWLIGWSFGGFVVADYLREYGEAEVAGVVLTGSHGGLLPRPEAAPKIFNSDLELAMQDAERFMALMSASEMSDQAMQYGVVSSLLLPPYVRNAMTGKRLDNRDLLARLKLPILIVLGEKDLSLPVKTLKPRLEENPAIQVKVYADVGHSAFLESPAIFSADVESFVTPLPGAVRRYLEAVNQHDAKQAVAQFATDGEMHLLQNRLARGHDALLEIERFHEVAQPLVKPEGLHVFREGDSIRVSMIRNVEQSRVFTAMGLPQVTTLGLDEAFRVNQGKISLARQPEFTPACQALMSAAMGSAIKWLNSQQDVRRSRLVPDGRVRMDADTVGEWITVLNQWRLSSVWTPDVKQVRACAG